MSALGKIDNTELMPASHSTMPASPDPVPPAMSSFIERIIMDPSIPMERVERALAMKERAEDRAREEEARQAQRAYFAAMAKCQTALPVVIKNRKNDHTRSTYADLAAIEDQAMPVIHAHGFALSFQPKGYNAQGELLLQWMIMHEGGHSESDIAAIPVDAAGSQGKVNKTGTQAFGSTVSYGRRYLECMLFNISTGDDNDGNKVPDRQQALISDDQYQQIADRMTALQINAPRYFKALEIDSLADLPAARFAEAMQRIDEREQLIAKAQEEKRP